MIEMMMDMTIKMMLQRWWWGRLPAAHVALHGLDRLWPGRSVVLHQKVAVLQQAAAPGGDHAREHGDDELDDHGDNAHKDGGKDFDEGGEQSHGDEEEVDDFVWIRWLGFCFTWFLPGFLLRSVSWT